MNTSKSNQEQRSKEKGYFCVSNVVSNGEIIKFYFRSKLTENIQINVQSTKEMNEISYHVLSTKGDVVASGTIEIFSSKSIDFDFTPTYDMVPKARIVVFYITSNGEIISDSLEFEVDNELRNFVSKLTKG